MGNGPRLRIWNCRHYRFKRKDESRNGYRERNLVTCVGDITLRIPKLRTGSFFPEDVVERYQRVDRAVVAAVAEMYATAHRPARCSASPRNSASRGCRKTRSAR